MAIEIEDFAEYMRMDLHDYLTELRIDPDPERMVQYDLQAFQEDLTLSDAELSTIKAYFQEYIESLFQTQQERLITQSRDKELEYTPTPSTYWKDEPNWKAEKVFFTESDSRSSREVYQRESTKTMRILITEIGYLDLDLTSKVHSAWLQVSPIVIKNRPKLKAGMLLVDMQSGLVECKVYRCSARFQLVEPVNHQSGAYDRENAEYQILRMFEHLGSHEHPKNPWPKFLQKPGLYQDSDDERMANRVLHLSRRKARSQ